MLNKYFDVKVLLDNGTSQDAINFLRYCYDNNASPNSSTLAIWNKEREHHALLNKLANELYDDVDLVFELVKLADQAARDTTDYDNYPQSAMDLLKWIENLLTRIKNNNA